MKRLLTTLLLGLLCHRGFSQTSPAAAADNLYPRTITVTGSAEMSVTPDQLFVSVRLREYLLKKGDGKQPLDKIRAAFLQACRASGIADSMIRIVSYSGADESTYRRRRRQQQPDLLASVTYELKLPNILLMDSLESRLDDAATVSFYIDHYRHSRETAFRRQLKIDAIRAAKEKAVYLAESIGEKVGVAVTITEPEEPGWAGAGAVSNSAYTAYNVQISPAGNTVSSSSEDSGAAPSESSALRQVRYRYEVTVIFSLK